MRLHRPVCVLGGLALLLATAACGGDATSGDDWPATSTLVDTRALSWADGSVIHLPGGDETDTHERVVSYVLAGDGAYARVGDPNSAALSVVHVTAGGAEATGIKADSLAASPDGRYLVTTDPTAGGDGLADENPLTIIDLETGTQVLHSGRYMGDPAGDDNYDDVDPGVLLVDDTDAYIDTVDGLRRFALATGGSRPLTQAERFAPDAPWNNIGQEPRTRWNADHTWAFETPVAAGWQGRFRDAGHRTVTPRTGASRWHFRLWLDAHTALGYAIKGPGDPHRRRLTAGDTAALMTCTVPDGACRVVPGSAKPYQQVRPYSDDPYDDIRPLPENQLP